MPLTNAEKQARHRAKIQAELDALRAAIGKDAQALIDALTAACEATGTDTLCRRLPDDPIEAMRELTHRLDGARLVRFNSRKIADREISSPPSDDA